jgi:hypothetical protein
MQPNTRRRRRCPADFSAKNNACDWEEFHMRNKGESCSLPFAAALALLAAGSSPLAEGIKPGLWKISLESRVAAAPGWQPEPFEITQCLSEADAQNPDRLLAGMGTEGVSGCDFLNRDYSGNRVRFGLSCAGQLGLTGQGEMNFTDTSMEGTIDVSFADAGQGGERTAMQNRLHAVYLGNCTGTGGSGPAASGATNLPGLLPPAPSAE